MLYKMKTLTVTTQLRQKLRHKINRILQKSQSKKTSQWTIVSLELRLTLRVYPLSKWRPLRYILKIWMREKSPCLIQDLKVLNPSQSSNSNNSICLTKSNNIQKEALVCSKIWLQPRIKLRFVTSTALNQ